MKNVPMFVGEPLVSLISPWLQEPEPTVWQALTPSKRHSPSVPVESSRGGKGKEQPLLLSMLL